MSRKWIQEERKRNYFITAAQEIIRKENGSFCFVKKGICQDMQNIK
ncbi:MAG TPA: hypothetical protein VKY40_10200 [Halanaerobiales bacterium]|nr:hypothetical protein [Halanaerobiales bacterium]